MAEFDEYARGYTAGMEHPVKRLLGRDAGDFLTVKARWLARHLGVARPAPASPPARLLDYGCGTGAFLLALRAVGLEAHMVGCDASSGMLEEASKSWRAGAAPDFHLVCDGHAPFADGSFDVVVLSSVLHHVAPGERNALLADAIRLLASGGHLVVFEHNPLNPLTRWVVKHTPIDQNAQLLRAGEVRRRLAHLGVVGATTRFLLFFPPRFAGLSRLERWLAWLPLGGQYAIVGKKRRAGGRRRLSASPSGF